MLMYKEQYYLTITIAAIALFCTFFSLELLELLELLAIPLPIIWWVGVISIKIYKEKIKK